MLGELFANASYIDVALVLLIGFILFSGIKVQRRVEQRIEEMEKKILALKKYQGDAFQSLDNRYVSLKKAFFDKTNELIAKLQAILKSNKAVMLEIDNKIKPLRASLDDTMDKVKATKDSLRKTILENEKEIKDIRKELNDFFKEIQRMKDDIRERTIDLEL
jgi:methyl-accepting chemotaxis protein